MILQVQMHMLHVIQSGDMIILLYQTKGMDMIGE